MASPALDPAVMRAVAHPLRLTILEHFWKSNQPLRATDIAKAVDKPVNAISYHIRKLADAGYLLPCPGPDGATGRDRWYICQSNGIQSEDSPSDTDSIEAQTAVLRTRYIQISERVAQAQTQSLSPQLHYDGNALFTTDQAVKLIDELHSVITKHLAQSGTQTDSPREPLTEFTLLFDLVPHKEPTLQEEANK